MRRAVFFDLDHTLADLDTGFHQGLEVVFGPECRAAGIDPATLRRHLDMVWPGLWRRMLSGDLEESRLRTAWFGAAASAAGLALGAARLEAMAEEYERVFDGALRLYADALPALRRLASRRDLVLGLLTNGPARRQRRRIEALGLDGRFGVTVISGEVGWTKPDPSFFAHALRLAAVPAARAAMIGDDPDTDMAGAAQAGLRTIWLNRARRRWPDGVAPEPDGEARDLEEAATIALSDR